MLQTQTTLKYEKNKVNISRCIDLYFDILKYLLKNKKIIDFKSSDFKNNHKENKISTKFTILTQAGLIIKLGDAAASYRVNLQTVTMENLNQKFIEIFFKILSKSDDTQTSQEIHKKYVEISRNKQLKLPIEKHEKVPLSFFLKPYINNNATNKCIIFSCILNYCEKNNTLGHFSPDNIFSENENALKQASVKDAKHLGDILCSTFLKKGILIKPNHGHYYLVPSHQLISYLLTDEQKQIIKDFENLACNEKNDFYTSAVVRLSPYFFHQDEKRKYEETITKNEEVAAAEILLSLKKAKL